MKEFVTIIDYGLGNLYSVKRALQESGCENIRISSKKDDILSANKLVLPGVGAYGDGMNGLKERGLVDAVISAAMSGTPILGICLGMQLLATYSEEFGFYDGLDLIPGVIKRIPNTSIVGDRLKIPFTNWAPLKLENEGIASSLFQGVQTEYVYFVHSYQFIPDNASEILASYHYGGHAITAAIQRNNITGLQFHPEKSGKVGLRIIKNFLQN